MIVQLVAIAYGRKFDIFNHRAIIASKRAVSFAGDREREYLGVLHLWESSRGEHGPPRQILASHEEGAIWNILKCHQISLSQRGMRGAVVGHTSVP